VTSLTVQGNYLADGYRYARYSGVRQLAASPGRPGSWYPDDWANAA
jgi:hypothetical protein